MNHLGNNQIDEVEYRLSVLQRKEDAKKHMKHSRRLMDGEIRQSVGETISRPRPKKK